jgi:hypothetical protein
MLKSIKIAARGAFLAFGLWGSYVYGVESIENINEDTEVSDAFASPKISDEESLWYFAESATTPEDIAKIKALASRVKYPGTDDEGQTLFFKPVCAETLEVLLQFYSSSIDIDSKDAEGNTALWHMVLVCMDCMDTLCRGDWRMVKMLLDYGANPCLKDKEGRVASQLFSIWKKEEAAAVQANGERPEGARKSLERLFEKTEKEMQKLRAAEEKWKAAHPDEQ